MGKVKILELCHFSSGICGVWNRVSEESQRLSSLGYEVRVFSSNRVKGSNQIAPSKETVNGVKISRFPAVKFGGESFMFWNFIDSAIDYSPDIIIAHVYRHPHTTSALKIKKELERKGKKCLVFLVTHAPFNEDSWSRGVISASAVKFYDKFLGRKTINNFDRVIVISNWEVSYLLKIGLNKQKILYLPNGVPPVFFKKAISSKTNKNKILFLGRIAPIKNLELAISALSELDKKYFIEFVGPVEKDYKKKLDDLAVQEKVGKRLIFSKPIYNQAEKIKKIDSALYFILPSKREGMPQSLVEAMARGRVVLGSDVEGIKDLVKNGYNGFTFKSNDLNSAISVIKKATGLDNKKLNKISSESKLFASQFNWGSIISKLDKFIKAELHTK